MKKIYFANDKRVSAKKLSELLIQALDYPQLKVTRSEAIEESSSRAVVRYRFNFNRTKPIEKRPVPKDRSTLIPYSVCKTTEPTAEVVFQVGKGMPMDNICMSKGAFQKLQEMACESIVTIQVPYLDGNMRKLATFGTVSFKKPYLENDSGDECPEEHLETKVMRIVNGTKKEVFVKDLPVKDMMEAISTIEAEKYRILLEQYRDEYDDFEKELYTWLKKNFDMPVYPINPAVHIEYMAEKQLYGDLPTPERMAKVAEMEMDAFAYGVEIPQVYYMNKAYKAGKYVKNKNRQLPDKFLHKVKVNEPLRHYFVPAAKYEGNNSTTTVTEKDTAWSKVDEAYEAYVYLKKNGMLLPGFQTCSECGAVESETYMVFDGEKWLCCTCAGVRITNFVEDSYDEDDSGDDVVVEDDVVVGTEDDGPVYYDAGDDSDDESEDGTDDDADDYDCE